MSIVISLPSISSAEYPNIFSAARLTNKIVLFVSIVAIASDADSAKARKRASLRRRASWPDNAASEYSAGRAGLFAIKSILTELFGKEPTSDRDSDCNETQTPLGPAPQQLPRNFQISKSVSEDSTDCDQGGPTDTKPKLPTFSRVRAVRA